MLLLMCCLPIPLNVISTPPLKFENSGVTLDKTGKCSSANVY
jgi:hypothetical protein